jgi:hypothetical protein
MRLATSRYQDFTPDMGIPIRITVGKPRFTFTHPLENVPALAPWELFSKQYKGIDHVPTERAVYRDRLESHVEAILASLAKVAARHPGRTGVLLCFENVRGGEECHRRWAADWFAERFGWDVPELDPPAASLTGDAADQLPFEG